MNERKRPSWAGIAAPLLLLLMVALAECKPTEAGKTDAGERRIGVLLVNHGSRSATWRNELLRLEENVRPQIMAQSGVVALTTAFMEYTEPSIATRLKEFDAQGITDVVLVPVFLTVSSHSFDDIPTIIGQKDDPHSREHMRLEKMERYTPKARVQITPLLDFRNILQENMLRRVKSMSSNPSEEGLTLIAYGDETYEKEWGELMKNVADHVKKNTGIDTYSYGWCGHLVHYDPQKTTTAIEEVLAKKKKSLVLPVLVAHDEMFQVKIIGDGIKKVKDNGSRVVYRADAILPDPGLEKWVVDITAEYTKKALAAADSEIASTEKENGGQ